MINEPLVLIPGFMTDDDLWRDISPFLSDRDIVYASLNEGSSIEELATRLLERLPQRFILLGFSMGGYVARQIAYSAPTRVEALILVGTSSRAGAPSSQTSSPQSFKGLSTRALARALHPSRASCRSLLDRLRAMSIRGGGDLYARLSTMERKSDHSKLGLITCPTLVVAAANDLLRPLEEGQELADALNTPLVVVEDCGHMVPMEKPEKLSKIIQDWLASL